MVVFGESRPAPAGLQRLRVQALRAIAWALALTNLVLVAAFGIPGTLNGGDLAILLAASGIHAVAGMTVGRRWQPGDPVTVVYLAAIVILVLLGIVTAQAPDSEGFWFALIPAGLAGIAFSGRGVAATLAVLGVGYVATANAGGGHTWGLTSVRLIGLAVLAWALWTLTSRLGEALTAAERQSSELQVANARLRELDALKDDFVSTVSHELRTPLTVILGLSATLNHRWERLDERQRLLVSERIEANARSLDSIISTLLDVARIERGALEQRTEVVDLGEVVRAATDRLDVLLRQHELSVQVATDRRVAGDSRLLDRVVENLLTNAARHTPPGTPVRVEVGFVAGAVTVAVTDGGPGVPPEAMARIGERFYRAAEPSTRSSAGVGLGLALVTEVLRAHGSCLEITSPTAGGARFAFRLAALPDASPAMPSDAVAAVRADPTTG